MSVARLTVVLGCLALAVCLSGCGTAPAWQRAEAKPVPPNDDDAWDAMASADESRVARRSSGGVTAVASQRPSLINVGIQLPRVSPDGEWIAYLDQDDQQAPASTDSLITGRGLGGLSLWLRPIESEGFASVIALDGVAWPAWSSDSRQLLFINYAKDRSVSLGIHDLRSGKTLRKSPGLRHMMMPSLSPDGRRVAVAAYGEVPDQSLVFLVDLETGRASPGPQPIGDGAQVFPFWLDDRSLVYVELSPDGGALMLWAEGGEPVVIAPLDLPGSVFDAQHALAGIAQPLSPDGGAFAWYSAARDRIVLTDLATGRPLALREGTRAGAWWGSSWFVAGRDERVELVRYESAAGVALQEKGGVAEAPRGLHLLPGRWVALWCDAASQSMLLAGQSDRPDRFALMQLWVVTRQE